MDSFVKVEDWRVKENSTVTYSVGGLILSNSAAVTANYWLYEIYDYEIAAGAVVLKEIPPNATAVGVPAQVVKLNGVRVTQDLDQIHMPDPVGMEFSDLQKQLEVLSERVGRLEEENRTLREATQK